MVYLVLLPFNKLNQTNPMEGEEELMYIGLDVHKLVYYGTGTYDQGKIIRSGMRV
jgi:hypothetical protein